MNQGDHAKIIAYISADLKLRGAHTARDRTCREVASPVLQNRLGGLSSKVVVFYSDSPYLFWVEPCGNDSVPRYERLGEVVLP